MVVDPPDGTVPVMKWAEDKRAYDLDHVADNWVHQTPWERCITRGMPAGMFPAGYNNAYQFIQTPGYVVIVLRDDSQRADHPARRPAAPRREHPARGTATRAGTGTALRSSSTRRTTTTRASIATSAATRTHPRHPAERSAARRRALHAGGREHDRSIASTVDDKNVYTKPWTVEMPLTRDSKYQMFEYACQEGNYATPNILAGGRAAEREAAKGTNP